MKYTFIKTNADGTEEVVKHYGVLGMKWGVRKDPLKMYQKSEKALQKKKKKAAKLKTKAEKAQLKAANYLAKGKTGTQKGMNKWGRLQAKAAKKQIKAQKYSNKVEKFKQSRDKILSKERQRQSDLTIKNLKAYLENPKDEKLRAALNKSNRKAMILVDPKRAAAINEIGIAYIQTQLENEKKKKKK